MIVAEPSPDVHVSRAGRLRALATDAAGELVVLGHDGDALGVDGREVGVLEEANEVRLSRLLEREHRGALEAQVRLELLRNLADEALERKLADQQLRRLLVATDLTKRDRAGAVAVRLLDTSRRRGALARRLRGELLAGRPANGVTERGGGGRVTMCCESGGCPLLSTCARFLQNFSTWQPLGTLQSAAHSLAAGGLACRLLCAGHLKCAESAVRATCNVVRNPGVKA